VCACDTVNVCVGVFVRECVCVSGRVKEWVNVCELMCECMCE
jgi:hypothetical protein